jgi:hypothetical protein
MAKMVREWCRAYAAEIDFAVDYQPWVVANFSGILCVDAVYQGDLALLLAVDPAAPDGPHHPTRGIHVASGPRFQSRKGTSIATQLSSPFQVVWPLPAVSSARRTSPEWK